MTMTSYSPFKTAKALRAASYHLEADSLEEAARVVHESECAAASARYPAERANASRCHREAVTRVQSAISHARRCGVI